jgi:hypothetical protein
MKPLSKAVLALALAFPFAGAAQADCDLKMEGYDARLREAPGYQAQLAPAVQRDLRRLRDAAYILRQHEQTAACEEVVAAMEALLENPNESAELSAAYDEWKIREQERIESSTPVSELIGELSADGMIGADVRNLEAEDLGEIDDVVFGTNDGASYVILSRGGFLGLGEQQVAIPFDSLKVSPDRETFYADLTVEEIENAPGFERGDLDWLDDEGMRQRNDAYFSKS